jgi:hypothetical protein
MVLLDGGDLLHLIATLQVSSRGTIRQARNMAKSKIIWMNTPEPADYAAALSFLSLIYSPAQSQSLVRSLRSRPPLERAAKDLLRAAGLPLLPKEESKVREDLKRISKGKPLAPVILVTGDMTTGIPLIVADGYHRICAACHFEENAIVQCRMTRTVGKSNVRRAR